MLGNPGHPTVARPAPDAEELREAGLPDASPAQSLPSACTRRLASFRPPGCPDDCPGRQGDGTCLSDLVADARARGAVIDLEVDRDGTWVPTGERAATPA